MNQDEVIPFSYKDLNNELLTYCRLINYDIKKICHTKMKNYVTNHLYSISNENIKPIDKFIFLFIYDLLAQQKYSYGVQASNKKIGMLLSISDSTISKSIKKLIDHKIIFQDKNRFSEKELIVNENINTWQVEIDNRRLSMIEETRKHMASSNKQLFEECKMLLSP